MTPYHYTHNNPINRIDPTGMEDGGLWDKFVRMFSSGEHTPVGTEAQVALNGGAAAVESIKNTAMEKLPSEGQVLETVDAISEAAGVVETASYTAAVATAVIPPISATFATAGTIAGGIQTAADATRVAIKPTDPASWAKLGANIISGQGGKIVGQGGQGLMTGTLVEEVFDQAVKTGANAVSSTAESIVKEKIDKKFD